jgi:nucleotide-binding universal stress UspA family protein
MSRTVERVLVAVDDSAASLQGVEIAVGLAASTGAEVRFVHVTGDGALRRALAPGGGEDALRDRVDRAVGALLDHAAARAKAAGVRHTTAALFGEPEAEVVTEARAWDAGLVVIGRSQSGAVGRPYVGHVTRHILEFSEVPVLVVPRPRSAPGPRARGAGDAPGVG